MLLSSVFLNFVLFKARASSCRMASPSIVSYSRQRGVTLVELVIAIVIVSIAMVASLKNFSVISGRSSDALIQARTLDLAQIYIDEIIAKNFDESTGVGGVPAYTGACRITNDGESRADYDDVDDFNGLNETPSFVDEDASTPVAERLSSIYANFNVSVDVLCDIGGVDTGLSVGVNGEGAKRVDITITDPTGKQSRFTAFKGNF